MMIPGPLFLQIALCSVLRTLPFLLLAGYPFRRQLRFSVPGTLLATVVFCALQLAADCMSVTGALSSGLLALFSTGLSLVFYAVAVKDRLGRLLFMLLVFSNAATLVSVLAKYLDGLFFGTASPVLFRHTFALCLLPAHLLITLPLAFFIRRIFINGLPIQTYRWRYLWLIPVSFHVIWHCHLYFIGSSSLRAARDLRNVLFLLFLNLAALLVYHTVVLLLLEQKKAADLLQENHLLTMQQLQYDNLQQRINETRQARHDLRHHTHLILEYLRAEKFRELEAYLARYTASLPDTQATTYCQHYATNALLGYFVTQAKALGIETDVFLQLPETLHLPETTLSVVLGNLLENAIEACQEVSGPKKITVRGKADLGAVFFEVTNPYNGKINRGKNGQLLSTKEDGRGLGLASVKQIAQSFGGLLELEPRGDVFRASILLPEQPADPQ